MRLSIFWSPPQERLIEQKANATILFLDVGDLESRACSLKSMLTIFCRERLALWSIWKNLKSIAIPMFSLAF